MSDPPTSYTALVEGQDHELIEISRSSSSSANTIRSDESAPGTQQHRAHHQEQTVAGYVSPALTVNGVIKIEGQRSKSGKQSTAVKIFHDWWPELLCILAILLALFATTLTLFLHQHGPLPQWPLRITINALLSVYIVILKSSVLLVLGSGEELWR